MFDLAKPIGREKAATLSGTRLSRTVPNLFDQYWVVVVVVASVVVAGVGSTTVVQDGRIGIAMRAVTMAMVFVFMVVAVWE